MSERELKDELLRVETELRRVQGERDGLTQRIAELQQKQYELMTTKPTT